MIAANNGWVVAFDNLSGTPVWLSDAICRLATGGGFSTRELYTNDEEMLFDATRPVILTGIDALVERHDLVDRAIILNLPRISEENRRDEESFWREFEAARPRILGALLDAVAAGLRNIDKVKLDRLPRMADFAKWITACEPASPWPKGGFMEAYTGNRAEAIETALESDPVAVAIREFMDDREEWTGTASDLLKELNGRADEKVQRSRSWPRTARALSGRLKRATTFLRVTGIEADSYREPNVTRRRMIMLRRVQTVQSVQTQQNQGSPLDAKLDAKSEGRVCVQFASSTESANHVGLDDIDALDAKIPTHSNDDDGGWEVF